MLLQYEFVAVLGRGGMGVVYKARQISLDRQVAVKVLPGDLIDDEDVNFVERFKQEARTMARMNHPAIVSVFDFGETANGLLYFVMEFVDGTDVSKMILANGALPPAHALAITAHVCDALAYAHSHGVVHRDIKPANILINMEGQVKVADFGLAKAGDAKELAMTKANIAMGTPDYVAPEALIAGVSVDGRADLYAIGVMLYEMLTAEIPRGMWAMPSVKIGADPRFDAIITRAMQADRDHRYQTAMEVRADLDRIMTMPLVQSGGQGSMAIPKQEVRRQRPGAPGSRPQAQGVSSPGQSTRRQKKSSSGQIAVAAAIGVLGLGAYLVFSGSSKSADDASAAAGRSLENSAKAAAADAAAVPLPKPSQNDKSVRPPAPPANPERVQTFGGHSYRLVNQEMDWEQARAKANSMGGHLMTITSKEEDEWLKRTFRPGPNIKGDMFWVGGQRKSVDGPWEWITGEPLNYQNWGRGWPDSNKSTRMGLTVHVSNSRPGWDDVSINSKAPFLVEWDNFGNTPAGSKPRQMVNLLARVDLDRDVVKGRWKKAGNGYELEKDKGALFLEFNYTPPEEYDFIVEFMVKGDGGSVNQHLSVQGHDFIWKNNVSNNGTFGLDVLDGKLMTAGEPGEAVAKLRGAMRPMQRYRSEIQVRKDGVRALLDGSEVLVWKGDFKRLSMEEKFKLRDAKHLGIGSWEHAAKFERAEVRIIAGSGGRAGGTLAATANKPAPAVDDPPPQPQPQKRMDPPNDPRIQQLEAGFQSRCEADAEKPYQTAVAALNQSYVTNGLGRARSVALARGDNTEMAALDAEIELIGKGQPLPENDAENLPASLVQLRKTYRESLARYAADRDAKMAPLYAIYAKALEDYVAELTKANRIDEAQKVRQFREDIAQRAAARKE